LKILNPLGYKLISPSLLRRCTVITKGKAVSEAAEKSKDSIGADYIWWLFNRSTKQHIAAYYSERQGTLSELSLNQCIGIWGADPDIDKLHDPHKPVIEQQHPSIPPKYADFVRRRSRIFREISNMRKISHHANVIRLEGVLELVQESKCTLFLIMELANGGELFDRIKIDCGTREDTARRFFRQLLDGVKHCHDEGVCHRDLKPENLLLEDFAGGLSTLKVLL
jgi:serine/threonine protein kinase